MTGILFLLFTALKKKIRIEDLLHYTVGGGDTTPNDKNFTSNLMNLVMQFRKVGTLIGLSIYYESETKILLKYVS